MRLEHLLSREKKIFLGLKIVQVKSYVFILPFRFVLKRIAGAKRQFDSVLSINYQKNGKEKFIDILKRRKYE